MIGALTIASANPTDADEIAALYRHHVLHGVATFEIVPPDAEEITWRLVKVLGEGHPWLTARDTAGTLVGYAYAGRFHPREAYRFTCEDSIYVAHDRLGQGVGAALLGPLIEAAEAGGFRQMIAQITSSESASVPLHRRFGFIETGRTTAVGWKFGRWLDVTTMQRALGQGDGAPPADEP